MMNVFSSRDPRDKGAETATDRFQADTRWPPQEGHGGVMTSISKHCMGPLRPVSLRLPPRPHPPFPTRPPGGHKLGGRPGERCTQGPRRAFAE